MAKETFPTFEIPTEMRAFAEKSMEQARQAFDGFISAAQKAVDSADKRASGLQSGAREMSALAIDFAERNIASSFAYAQRLVHAKDPQEVMALHADYVKSQMATLTEQAKTLSEEATKKVAKAAE